MEDVRNSYCKHDTDANLLASIHLQLPQNGDWHDCEDEIHDEDNDMTRVVTLMQTVAFSSRDSLVPRIRERNAPE
jgi:hypothetical protein